MLFRNEPIQKKLLWIILLINGIVILITCISFFMYEYYIFRKVIVENASVIARITATNSTAALAFENTEDATEVIQALKAETHIVAAGIYDNKGKLFCKYVKDSVRQALPTSLPTKQSRFGHSYLEVVAPVVLEGRQLGTLYLKSDLNAMNDRMVVYGFIVAFVLIASLLLTYILVKILKKSITAPIMALARTAALVSS